jgi:UDP-2-acetamido-2,6-beta-L-arabino-hexul-4-ose reductase
LLPIELHKDERGSLFELLRTDSSEGQIFFSTTNPNYIRGQHFHMRKFERFCVIKGNARISMRKLGDDEVHNYYVNGDDIKVFDTPVMYTHNIENVGNEEMVAVFWVSKLLNKNDIDTYWEDV